MAEQNTYNTTIGGAGAEEGSSSVAGRSGDGEGQGKVGTVLTSRSAPTGPGSEPKQISYEGAAAKQGIKGSNTSLTIQRLVTPMRGQFMPQSKNMSNGLP